MQLNLRIKYIDNMKKRSKFHLQIKKDAIEYTIGQLELAKQNIIRKFAAKNAQQKQDIVEKKKKLANQRKTLTLLKTKIKKDLKTGNLNKITVNENKAKIIQGQISTLQDLIIITGKTSPEQIKAENQKILITSHIKSLQRVLDEFFDRTAQKIIDFDKYNKDAITKLQQELMKQNEVDR